ncbi:MAG: Gfo/Idh/MocA family oxidoreductase [Gemmatimonadetes bacterium]|jgi:predicted dehydrogenase|nr:Gfo/Idh/MocA family oxidoreductase [Gemmatimonadota bacterium]MBT4612573.1 Gfo/Idh/MocA family oxidoreductase [Gemmatimonadota bacterium]MBT5059174.1 Gfo/Idh/MocA family oxidoreductase [Gemmatimonadota bacterium]MBT5144157.1 Gfo/Idh/MocA family oxidoreductase [Gemmatimonadota bacterium]MBT5586629.1 Gfo/Idh/MocA family oxidoreductase [Gemmatimonadota bacterium]
MSSAIVRVGIVGMGIGRPNGRALHADPRAQVVALCDLQPDRMEEFAGELEAGPVAGDPIKRYTDYRKMCRDPQIDAVFVGTPNQWHVPVALEAVRCDKHVMVTKPLADGEAPARRLVKAAEKAGVVNMMSLSTRFSPENRYLQDKARAGYFGDIYYARSRSVRRNGIPAWNLGFIQPGGGAFRDMGVHYLDAAWAIMGHPRPVTVSGVSGAIFGPKGRGYSRPTPRKVWRQFDTDDFAGGFIRFADGSGLQIESFWASHQPAERQIELFGTEAGARLQPLTLYTTDAQGREEDVSVALSQQDAADPWQALASHFVGCILDGDTCSAPLRHGLQVQSMLEAMLRSAESGREVALRDSK